MAIADRLQSGMLTVTVDGVSVQVQPGATALDALRAAGREVPTACHDDRLKPAGACRTCLVNVKGMAKPASSCTLPVTDGMEITTDDPDLVLYRRGVLRMLAHGYPKHLVEEVPEKPFHKWLKEYGLVEECGGESTGEDISNPYFRFDPAACIECSRCVRICDEIQGSRVWNFVDRGAMMKLEPDSMRTVLESTCKSCGACVDTCPTGALVDKKRLKRGLPTAWTKTTCPYCGVGCELNVGTRDDRIVQVLPVLNARVNKGHLCVKGRYASGYVESPDRVKMPLIRKNGVLTEVSWDEALAYCAQEFKKVIAKHGPGSVGVLGSARSTNEDCYVAQKFARLVIGTNNVDSCARVCHAPTAAAMASLLQTGAATNSYEDIDLAKTILVTGANPTECHPVIGDRLRQAVRRGANLIVIDPRRTEMAEEADIHLQITPGTNIPIFSAMAHVILEAGLADMEFIRDRVDGLEEFREKVAEWTPERAGEVCGVDPELIRKAAILYATAKPSLSTHGLGMTEHYQGVEGIMALVNMALLTGNIGKRGTGVNPLRGQNNVQGSAHMGCEPSRLAGYVPIADAKERFVDVWQQDFPTEKGWNLMEMLEQARQDQFKSLYCIGYDIYHTDSGAHLTAEAFRKMEFVLVQDIFVNKTAEEFAHVVLPACTSFEHDGTFMNAERRVQRVRAAVPPVGESKPDWEITQLLAHAMGHPEGFQFKGAEDVWNEVRKVWLPGGGMSYQRLEEGGLQWPCPTEDHPGTTMLHAESFTKTVRTTFAELDHVPSPEQVSAEYPVLMNSGRTLHQFNAATMTGRTDNNVFRPTDTLDVHPLDAADWGLSEGEKVRVVSQYGQAEIPVRIDSRVRRGETFATFHDPKVMLNWATSPVKDRKVGTPAYKRTAIRIEKLG